MEHHPHQNDANALVTTLTLNRPKANAMGSGMLHSAIVCQNWNAPKQNLAVSF
jgi:enoyl-CoA hydratase/carnithine racemase